MTTAKASREERREQVLTQSTASIVGSISEAVVAKDGEPFFLCPPDGRVPCEGGHGFGLYYHDCRYLSGYEITMAGSRLNSLAATDADAREITLVLTNPEMRIGDDRIGKDQLGISWTRMVDGETPALGDTLEIHNYGREPVALPLEMRFRARFEDVFEIRGLVSQSQGTLLPPSWRGDRLEFGYAGADGIDRWLRLAFEPQPVRRHPDGADFDLEIGGREQATIRVTAAIEEEVKPGATPIERRDAPRAEVETPTGRRAPQPESDWIGGAFGSVLLRTSSLVLDAALDRSFADLRMLVARLDGHRYFEAGIPWFATLFGRDALISSSQTLAFDAGIAADTLRLLAGRQGQQVDEWRDEAPGKILHELRIGELARLGEIPHTPFFGTVDATPLFLILVGQHAAWTGRLDLFDELREPIDAALGWLDRYADSDGDGYVDYRSQTEHGLVNQGWKDSGNAIVMADGRIAEPPIALVEVQGYAHRAWLEVATLLERVGDAERAADLRRRASDMRARFERDFWSEELGCYVLALASGEPCAVVSSNPGHALWSGIASEDHGRRTGRRLLAPDMFNGFGIRTLSADSAAYHPIGYHLGTVWPHDNAIIADGLRRYGLDDEAERIFTALIEAAADFRSARLPECFAGYDRAEYGVPVRYPVACHPQAWAAGTVPQLLVSSLGLMPEAFERRLRVVRPRLPGFVDTVEIRDLVVGDARARLRFNRTGASTEVEVVSVDGDLDVVVEPGPT